MTILILTTMFAAFVTGGLGYGFSSITVPVALLYYSNRILNPALVLLEVGINIQTLFLNRNNLKGMWKRLGAIIVGLIPAVVVGSFLLKITDVTYLKLVTYCLLVPLIYLQAIGFRKALGLRKRIGLAFGALVGLLYSLTTISGPPIAIALNNERFGKKDFRAAMGIIRTVESGTTLIAYYFLGIFTFESLKLFLWITPGVVLSMAFGAFFLGKLEPTVFRRMCITLDVWIISFGLLRSVLGFNWLPNWACYFIFVFLILFDGVLLHRFFKRRHYGSLVKNGNSQR
jgi:uncharacterized membrane protein YfcA